MAHFEKMVFKSISKIVASSHPCKRLDIDDSVQTLTTIPRRFRRHAVERVLQWRAKSFQSPDRHVLYRGDAEGDDSVDRKEEIQIVQGQVVTLRAHDSHDFGAAASGEVIPTYWREEFETGSPDTEVARSYFFMACDVYFARALAVLAGCEEEEAGDSAPPIPEDRMKGVVSYALASLNSARPDLWKLKGWKKKKLDELASSWESRWQWLVGLRNESWRMAISSICQVNSQAQYLVSEFVRFASNKDNKPERVARALVTLGGIRFRIRVSWCIFSTVATMKQLTDLFVSGLSGRSYAKHALMESFTEILRDAAHLEWEKLENYTPWVHSLTHLFDVVWRWLQKKRFSCQPTLKRKHRSAACPLLVAILQCLPQENFLTLFPDVVTFLTQCLSDNVEDLRVRAIRGAADILKDYLAQHKGTRRDIRMTIVDDIVKKFFVIHPHHHLYKENLLACELGGLLREALSKMIFAVVGNVSHDYAPKYREFAINEIIMPILERYTQFNEKPPKKPKGKETIEDAITKRWIHYSSCMLLALEIVSTNTSLARDIQRMQKRSHLRLPLLRILGVCCKELFAPNHDHLVASKAPQVLDICTRVYIRAMECVPVVFEATDAALWSNEYYMDCKDKTRVGDPFSCSRPVLLTVADSLFHHNEKVSAAAEYVVEWAVCSTHLVRGLIGNRMLQICMEVTAAQTPDAVRCLDILDRYLDLCIAQQRSPQGPRFVMPDSVLKKSSEAKLMPEDKGRSKPLKFLLCDLEALCLVALCSFDVGIRTRGFQLLKTARTIKNDNHDNAPLPCCTPTEQGTPTVQILFSNIGEWGMIGLCKGDEKAGLCDVIMRLSKAILKDAEAQNAMMQADDLTIHHLSDKVRRKKTSAVAHMSSFEKVQMYASSNNFAPNEEGSELGWMTVLGSIWRHLCSNKVAPFSVALAWAAISKSVMLQINQQGKLAQGVAQWILQLQVSVLGGNMSRKEIAKHDIELDFKHLSNEPKITFGVAAWQPSPLDTLRGRKHKFPQSIEEHFISILYKNKLDHDDRKNTSNKTRPVRRLYPIFRALLEMLGDCNPENRNGAVMCLSSARPDQLSPLVYWLLEELPITNFFDHEGCFMEEDKHDDNKHKTKKLESSEKLTWMSVSSILELVIGRVTENMRYAEAIGELMHPYLRSFLSQTMEMLSDKKNELRWDLLELRIHCCRIITGLCQCVKLGYARAFDRKFREKLFRILVVWSGVTRPGETFFHRAKKHRVLLMKHTNLKNKQKVAELHDAKMQSLSTHAGKAITSLLDGPTFCTMLQRLKHARRQPNGSQPVDVTNLVKASRVYIWIDTALQVDPRDNPTAASCAVDALCALLRTNPELTSGLFVSQCYIGPNRVARRYFEAIARVLIEDEPNVLAATATAEEEEQEHEDEDAPNQQDMHDKKHQQLDDDKPTLDPAQNANPKAQVSSCSSRSEQLEWYRLVVLVMFKVADVEPWVRSYALCVLAKVSEIYPNHYILRHSSDIDDPSEAKTPLEDASFLGLNSCVQDGRMALQRAVSEHISSSLAHTPTAICDVCYEVESKLMLMVNSHEDEENTTAYQTRRADAQTRRLLSILAPWLECLELNVNDYAHRHQQRQAHQRHQHQHPINADPNIGVEQDTEIQSLDDPYEDIDSPDTAAARIAMILMRISSQFSSIHPEETRQLWLAAAQEKTNIPFYIRHLLKFGGLVHQREAFNDQVWIGTARRVALLLATVNGEVTALALAEYITQHFMSNPESPAAAEEDALVIQMGMLMLEPVSEQVDIVRVLQENLKIDLLSPVLYCAIMSVVGSQDKKVRKAARKLLAHLLYHNEVRHQIMQPFQPSHDKLHTNKASACSDQKLFARSPRWTIIKIIAGLTNSQPPRQVHSYWYTKEFYRKMKSDGDYASSINMRGDQIQDAELIHLMAKLVSDATQRQTKSSVSLMRCAMRMLTSEFHDISHLRTAAVIFQDLATNDSGFKFVPQLCQFIFHLIQSRRIPIYDLGTNENVHQTGPLNRPEPPSLGCTRISMSLECLHALILKLPQVFATHTNHNHAHAIGSLSASGSIPPPILESKRGGGLGGAVTFLENQEHKDTLLQVTSACVSIICRLLPDSSTSNFDEDMEAMFNTCFRLLLAALLRCDRSLISRLCRPLIDSSINMKIVMPSARLWESCLKALGAKGVKANATKLILEIAVWPSSNGLAQQQQQQQQQQDQQQHMNDGASLSSQCTLSCSDPTWGRLADVHRLVLSSILCALSMLRAECDERAEKQQQQQSGVMCLESFEMQRFISNAKERISSVLEHNRNRRPEHVVVINTDTKHKINTANQPNQPNTNSNHLAPPEVKQSQSLVVKSTTLKHVQLLLHFLQTQINVETIKEGKTHHQQHRYSRYHPARSRSRSKEALARKQTAYRSTHHKHRHSHDTNKSNKLRALRSGSVSSLDSGSCDGDSQSRLTADSNFYQGHWLGEFMSKVRDAFSALYQERTSFDNQSAISFATLSSRGSHTTDIAASDRSVELARVDAQVDSDPHMHVKEIWDVLFLELQDIQQNQGQVRHGMSSGSIGSCMSSSFMSRSSKLKNVNILKDFPISMLSDLVPLIPAEVFRNQYEVQAVSIITRLHSSAKSLPAIKRFVNCLSRFTRSEPPKITITVHPVNENEQDQNSPGNMSVKAKQQANLDKNGGKEKSLRYRRLSTAAEVFGAIPTVDAKLLFGDTIETEELPDLARDIEDPHVQSMPSFKSLPCPDDDSSGDSRPASTQPNVAALKPSEAPPAIPKSAVPKVTRFVAKSGAAAPKRANKPRIVKHNPRIVKHNPTADDHDTSATHTAFAVSVPRPTPVSPPRPMKSQHTARHPKLRTPTLEEKHRNNDNNNHHHPHTHPHPQPHPHQHAMNNEREQGNNANINNNYFNRNNKQAVDSDHRRYNNQAVDSDHTRYLSPKWGGMRHPKLDSDSNIRHQPGLPGIGAGLGFRRVTAKGKNTLDLVMKAHRSHFSPNKPISSTNARRVLGPGNGGRNNIPRLAVPDAQAIGGNRHQLRRVRAKKMREAHISTAGLAKKMEF